MADATLEALLEVQDMDLAADQLRHRRDALAEKAALVTATADRGEVDARMTVAGERLAVLERSSRRLEDEIAALEAKATEEDRRLYSGSIASPRELQALQDEVVSLRRRARRLEDDLLEIMEETEPVAATVNDLEAEQGRLDGEIERLGDVVAEQERAIDDDLAGTARTREAAAAKVPADLLATYEKVRARRDGVGVARLDGNRCGGCHLTLPATEVDALRRASSDAVVFHEECGRILVRP